MSITRVNSGAWAYSATNPAPTYSTNVIGDRMYLVVLWKSSVSTNSNGPSTPSGWTEVAKVLPDISTNKTGGYTAISGIDTGNMGFAIYYKDIDSVLSGTLTITMSNNNVAGASFTTFRRTNTNYTWDSPQYVYGLRTTTPTSPMTVSLDTPATIGLKANDYLLCGMAIPTDVTTPAQFSAQTFTHTGTTFSGWSEIAEPDSSLGGDMGGWIGGVSISNGTDTAAALSIQATLTGTLTNVRGPVFALRLRETEPPPADPWTTFVDSFDTKDVNLWNWPLPTVADVSGSSLFVMPSGSATVQTKNKYALTNSSVYFECAFQSSGSMNAYLHTISNDLATGTIPFVSCDVGGSLYLGVGANYATLTFNPVSHRYYKILHSGSDIVFQTSPDGNAWTTQHTVTGHPGGGEFYLTLGCVNPAPYQEFPGVNVTSGPPSTAPVDYWGVAA